MGFKYQQQIEQRAPLDSRVFPLVAGLVLLFACELVFAAENEADSRINFSITETISISQLQDFDFNYDPGVNGTSGAWQQTKDFCVYRSGNGGAYDIYFNGDAGTGSAADGAAFAIGNASLGQIAYGVRYNYDNSGQSAVPVQPGSSNKLPGIGDQADKNCATQRAQLTVEFDNAELATARDGNYGGTLYVYVAPR